MMHVCLRKPLLKVFCRWKEKYRGAKRRSLAPHFTALSRCLSLIDPPPLGVQLDRGGKNVF